MSNPQPLSLIQERRLRAFIYAQPALTLIQFLSKWQVSQEFVAELCRCDVRTVKRWRRQGRNYEAPQHYQWYLALADLILEHFDDLPEALKNLLCPQEYQ